MTQLRWLGGVALGVALVLSGCGGSTASSSSATSNALSQPGGTSAGSANNTSAGTNATDTADTATSDRLELSVTNKPDQAQYTEGVLSAPGGTPILVTYVNPSQQAHNWVLVEPGKEQAVADAAAAKGGNPEGIDGVIAWSETITNSSTTIEVPALEGQESFPYICTVPGHYAAGHKGAINILSR